MEQLYNKLLFLLKITKLTHYEANTTKSEPLNKPAITEYLIILDASDLLLMVNFVV